MGEREQWGSRIGLILAMAGNAIGLGNFLRFPVQASQNGGGAFMIPYFISFIVLGIPLMWVEWGIGRYGGTIGHGTSPGIFDAIWKNRIAKYIGILGIFLPLVILIYYVYICSWTLSYSLASLLNLYPRSGALGAGATATEILKPYQGYLSAYLGSNGSGLFLTPPAATIIFFIITLGISLWILAKGISGGIEKLSKFAVPLLFIMAAILFIRIVTLPRSVGSGASVAEGFAFLWEPDFSGLLNARVWLAAAGQVFFTLSLGLGAILTFASYVKKDEDIALDGLATASLNEFAEVIFGSTIAIVTAVIFFGADGAREVAGNGAFGLGFISMPAIFTHMALGGFFGFLWFLLLFFAGLTSIVALAQPVIAFLEDEFGWVRRKSVIALGVFFVVTTPMAMFLRGSLDEMDFWVATFALVILALFEMIIFFWILGAERAWEEITRGAHIKVPRVFFYLMKYVTPAFLLVILIAWSWQQLPGVLAKGGAGIWFTRAFLAGLLVFHLVVVHIAWKRRGLR